MLDHDGNPIPAIKVHIAHQTLVLEIMARAADSTFHIETGDVIEIELPVTLEVLADALVNALKKSSRSVSSLTVEEAAHLANRPILKILGVSSQKFLQEWRHGYILEHEGQYLIRQLTEEKGQLVAMSDKFETLPNDSSGDILCRSVAKVMDIPLIASI